jgi:hypothetical protein
LPLREGRASAAPVAYPDASGSAHVVALCSNHDVPSSNSGQPSVAVRAVQAVVRAARDHTRLPPCQRLFSGSDVRCRS